MCCEDKTKQSKIFGYKLNTFKIARNLDQFLVLKHFMSYLTLVLEKGFKKTTHVKRLCHSDGIVKYFL